MRKPKKTFLEIKNGLILLLDINECMEDPRPCDENALCDNSPGTYRCQCLDGYRDATDVPGKECDDINECNEGTFVYFFTVAFAQRTKKIF